MTSTLPFGTTTLAYARDQTPLVLPIYTPKSPFTGPQKPCGSRPSIIHTSIRKFDRCSRLERTSLPPCPLYTPSKHAIHPDTIRCGLSLIAFSLLLSRVPPGVDPKIRPKVSLNSNPYHAKALLVCSFHPSLLPFNKKFYFT